jgi:hypothetical protein
VKYSNFGRGLFGAWLLVGSTAGVFAACSSSDDSPDDAGAGTGGAQGGKGGNTQGGTSTSGKGGTAAGGKGGTATGGTSSNAGDTGTAGANAGDAGAGPSPSAGAGGESAGGNASGGAGGSSDAGAAGSSGCVEAAHCDSGNGCELASTCQTGVCTALDPKLAPVDQKQLGGVPDTWNVFDSEAIGQLITVGKTGLLSGVELSLSVSCNATVGALRVDIYNTVGGALLGKGTVPMSAVACKTGGNLAAGTIGAAFFDLSSQCIAVTAGQKLRIELHLNSVPGVCTADHCVGGPAAGSGCNTDALCTGILISASQPSTYAGGSISFGAVAGSADDNLNFKTFVSE